MNAGDCLQVNFQNLLAPQANPNNANPPIMQIDDQIASRVTGFHVMGMSLAGSIASDAAFVGENPNSMVPPGGTATYTYEAESEGGYMAYSYGGPLGGDGTGGNISNGLWAAVNVEPKGARWYRSHVTEEDIRHATVGTTPQGQPILDYEATYPNAEPWLSEGKAGDPVLNIVSPAGEIVHSDLYAVIAGPNPDGSFPASTYPLESTGKVNPALPDRLDAFREFTVIFHDDVVVRQAFPGWWDDPVFNHTLHGVRDSFMINYGSGGIGAEIVANRLGVGPMHDCLNCAYEEFFLSSQSVGDPANLVDIPANVGLEQCDPALNNCEAVGPKANEVLYPDDTANVWHSYMHDNVKFRNLHAGPKEHHMFHLHNHQWLMNPNDDNSNYLDVQGMGPGSSYTYEINFGGSGNRNITAGDAIFHCHFYPHFAQGMWGMWRIHDVVETGTVLEVSDGQDGFHTAPFALQSAKPAAGARAYPDGEVIAGVAIPAVVPLPGQAMPPMPGAVTVVAQDRNNDGVPESSQAQIDYTDTDPALVDTRAVLPQLADAPDGTTTNPDLQLNPNGLKNPGYPFWIAGLEQTVGQRSTTAPMDMFADPLNPQNGGWDGGLPRHLLEGYAAGGASTNIQSRFDFTKVVDLAPAIFLPETGTEIERVAMSFHANRFRPSSKLLLDGGGSAPVDFETNGLLPVVGAPFFEPCRDDAGDLLLTGQSGYKFFDGAGGLTNGTDITILNGADDPRVYKAANIQLDVVFNKLGDHFPQQRIISLWEDVAPFLAKEKPPEPFVFRVNTYDCVNYLQTNLVPEFYELDDYQVRTPTDIIGQHMHLPKWDLVSADGSANGWNYEDGVLAAETVRERIEAINAFNDLNAPGTPHLTPLPHPFFGAGPDNHYLGARTLFQRWFIDPLHNSDGDERGLGVTFTHDHFGPSTHQQVGLYATLLVEPYNSQWVHNETGEPLGVRADGGPTSWQAAILADIDGDGEDDSWREFYLDGSDFQHAYKKDVFVGVNEAGEVVPPTADTFRDAINPSVREEAPLPDAIRHFAVCPGGVPRPCPEAISADDPGFMVVNYRNEPVGYRVYDPNAIGPDGKQGAQTAGEAGDLAFALQTRTDRAIPQLNTRKGDTPYPLLTKNTRPGDPFTPKLRVVDGDFVRIRVQWGGQEETHVVTFSGQKWLKEGGSYGISPDTGWKNAQGIGIAEKFTFATPITRTILEGGGQTDYFYGANAAQDGIWSGMWGVMRSYAKNRPNLFTLPNNDRQNPIVATNADDFKRTVCPTDAPLRRYHVIAVAENEVGRNQLGATLVPNDPLVDQQHAGMTPDPNGGTLVYNARDPGVFTGAVPRRERGYGDSCRAQGRRSQSFPLRSVSRPRD